MLACSLTGIVCCIHWCILHRLGQQFPSATSSTPCQSDTRSSRGTSRRLDIRYSLSLRLLSVFSTEGFSPSLPPSFSLSLPPSLHLSRTLCHHIPLPSIALSHQEFSRMVHMLQAYCLISTGVRISCHNQTGKGSVLYNMCSVIYVEVGDSHIEIYVCTKNERVSEYIAQQMHTV